MRRRGWLQSSLILMRVAIFDLDGTVLRVNSWQVFYWWMLGFRPLAAPRLLAWLAARRLGLVEGRALREATLTTLRGADAATVEEIGRQVCRERLIPAVRPEARRAVARARAEGCEPVLATAAFDFLARPVADELGIGEVICSTIAFADGKCLGRFAGLETRGTAKAEAVRARFTHRGIEWNASRAYSDDAEDEPLWSLVGDPVFVSATGTRPDDLPAHVRGEIWQNSE